MKNLGMIANQVVRESRGDLSAYRPLVSPTGKDIVLNPATGKFEAAETAHNAAAGMFVDCWTSWDAAIARPYESELVLFADAKAVGMQGLGSQPEAFGSLEFKWNAMKMGAGQWETDMFAGEDRATNDAETFESQSLPLPIDHAILKTYIRTTEAAKRGVFGSGMGAIDLESSLIYSMGSGLGRKKELQLLNGITNKDGSLFKYNNNYCFGYRNAPGRFRKQITAAWSGSGVTAENIRVEVYGWCKEFVPIVGQRKELTLYVNPTYMEKIDMPISTYTPDYTVRNWLIKVIPQLKDVKLSNALPSDEVLMVHLAPDTVQIINGFGPTTIMWKSESGMENNILMLNLQVPLVKYKYFQELDITTGKLKAAVKTTGILQAKVGSVPAE